MLTQLLLIGMAVFSNVASVGAPKPLGDEVLVRPYARDECILWKCDFEHKAWKKTNVTENYELFTECVDKCELDLITQWINSWLKDILKDQKMMKDGKKSKKGLSCCFK